MLTCKIFISFCGKKKKLCQSTDLWRH